MTRLNREYLTVCILKLADLRYTGSPAQLAVRLGISERSVKRIVGDMRKGGHKIRYSRPSISYVRENEYYT
jgi:biotin operon repressor